MTTDVSAGKPVRNKLSLLCEEKVMCLDLEIVQKSGPFKAVPKALRPAIKSPDRLYFNTHQPCYFEELYRTLTNETDYKITANL